MKNFWPRYEWKRCGSNEESCYENECGRREIKRKTEQNTRTDGVETDARIAGVGERDVGNRAV